MSDSTRWSTSVVVSNDVLSSAQGSALLKTQRPISKACQTIMCSTCSKETKHCIAGASPLENIYNDVYLLFDQPMNGTQHLTKNVFS